MNFLIGFLTKIAHMGFEGKVNVNVNVTDSWFSNAYSHKVNASMFLDLKNAFDIVDPDILLAKLSLYGIVGVSHNWFSTYLTGRQQYCHISGHKSSLNLFRVEFPRVHALVPFFSSCT